MVLGNFPFRCVQLLRIVGKGPTRAVVVGIYLSLFSVSPSLYSPRTVTPKAINQPSITEELSSLKKPQKPHRTCTLFLFSIVLSNTQNMIGSKETALDVTTMLEKTANGTASEVDEASVSLY